MAVGLVKWEGPFAVVAGAIVLTYRGTRHCFVQDLSQRVFDALVADCRVDRDVLKKFRGCYLRDINLSTTPGVDDTWVDDILAAGCGYIEVLGLANSNLSTPALQRIFAAELKIRSLNLGRCKSLTADAFKTIGGEAARGGTGAL